MPDIGLWLMVFLRVSSMLAVFPVFSASNFPVQLRLALGALTAMLVSASVPAPPPPADLWALVGTMAVEIGIGLMIGFVSKIIFYALEVAGALIGVNIGTSMPAGMNPMSQDMSTAPSTMLYYLAIMLWLTLDMHHWMLLAFQRSYVFVPIGGAHITPELASDFIARTSGMFVVALQLAAPLMAVSFIITLIFAVLGRAVPQMNVFHESFAIRPLVGLVVFGLTIDLMSEHIVNYMHRLPEDLLRTAQLLGTHA